MGNTTEDEHIAMLPIHGNDNHAWCSICGDDNVALVIQGGGVMRGTNCYYCGNTIVLCSKHAAQMGHELAALKCEAIRAHNVVASGSGGDIVEKH